MMLFPIEVPLGPVVFVAPHPDDETLGCGGLIAACVERGDRMHTVFVTDGSASHPGSREWTRARLAVQREVEATEALRRLGAGGQPRTFLRLPDAAMPDRSRTQYAVARDAVVAILRDLAPALVVLPWRRDPHCDHRASWALATEAIAIAGIAPLILEYAIWLDELGAGGDYPHEGEAEAVFIRVPAAVKRHALAAHVSQLGELIHDDPQGFVLHATTIERLTGGHETYWRPCPTA